MSAATTTSIVRRLARTMRMTIVPVIVPVIAPAILMLATLGAGCGESASELLVPTPDTTIGQGTTGASLYRYHCSACHGLEGRPLVASSSDLRDYDSSFAVFDSVLSTGPGLMPRYPELDAGERQLIYDHVRAFTR
jgi:mono/diheme cytochrome c family protein